jgi:RNase adapter protein RapZ
MAPEVPTHRPLVFVTGLSGAGMSSVLKTLEDLDFEVFDNFPLSLVGPLLADPAPPGHTGIAVGLDTRTRGFCAERVRAAQRAYKAQLVFIACDVGALHRRFSETRRRHPLARMAPVRVGIEAEAQALAPLRDVADLVIDTTELSVPDLRHILEGHFGQRGRDLLAVTLMSFGFRYGPPREADIVLDVRFLANPHWAAALRHKTGRDAEVAAHIEADPALGEFLSGVKSLLGPLLPRYAAAGKRYLTIAIGCTGGRHRSVYCVERLAPWLAGLAPHLDVEHRDIAR